MKTRRFVNAATAFLALVVAGCGVQTHDLKPADRNRAAIGTVKANADENNGALEVHAGHLAPSASLDSTLSGLLIP
jgi:predicted outer membrane protein